MDSPGRQERVLAVLAAVREQLVQGWVQEAWWVTRAPSGPQRTVRALGATSEPGQVSGACLVGAVLNSTGSDRPQPAWVAGPVVDALYDALWEARGGHAELTSRVSSPPVRLARVQTLTRWNDTPGRTREQVLEVVDRAICRTIMTLVGAGKPPGVEALRPYP